MRTRESGPGRALARFWLRPEVITTAALTIVLFPATVVSVLDAAGPPVVQWLAIGLFAVLHATSFAALRYPRAAFVGASIVMLALALLPQSGPVSATLSPSSIAFLLCLVQVAVQCGLRISVVALAVGVAGSGIVALLATGLPDATLRFGSFVGLAAVNAAAWAFGALERSRRIRVADAARMQADRAVLAERGRISRDLHDVVAHAVTVMVAQAEVARAFLTEDPRTSTRALEVVMRTGRDALRGMHGIVTDAAPLSPAPDLDTVRALIADARTPQLDVVLDERGDPGRLAPAAMLALHHVVREALTNAIRHTVPPLRVTVALHWSPRELDAAVRDDGGAGRRDHGLGTGTGLLGLAERVRWAGGRFSAGPEGHEEEGREGGRAGWAVRAVLPCDHEAGSNSTSPAERTAR